MIEPNNTMTIRQKEAAGGDEIAHKKTIVFFLHFAASRTPTPACRLRHIAVFSNQ